MKSLGVLVERAKKLLLRNKTKKVLFLMKYILDNIDYYPFFCNLQITIKCNLNCLHCGFSAGEKDKDELTFHELTNLINDLSQLNCERIQITGGEPLLRDDWEAIAKHISKLGIEATLISNGYRITADIAKRINDCGISTVGISIDGTGNSHNKIRNNSNSYKRALIAIQNLNDNGVSTGVITTINKYNIDELEELRQVLIQHNVISWRLQIPSLMGRMKNRNDIVPAPADIGQINSYIAGCRNDSRILVIPGDSIGFFGPYEKTIRDVGGDLPYFTGCYAGCLSVAIESNGNVKGCLALPSEFCEGNIREASLKEIWFRKDSFSYNRKFNVSMLEGFCKNCEFGEICRAGCKSCAYGATGHLHDNPFCDYRINIIGDKSWWRINKIPYA